MTASLRALLVLAALAGSLVLAVVIDGMRAPAPPPSRALLPGLDPEQVTELRWSRAHGPDSRVTREAAIWVAPRSTVDQQTVAAVLSTLRAARWHRRDVKAIAGTTKAQLVVFAPRKHVIEIAESLVGADQTWLVIDGGDARLVDGWVARALDPSPLALRMRFPLAEAASADTILINGKLEIKGHPRLLDHTFPGRGSGFGPPPVIWLDPRFVDRLERALAELELVAEASASGDAAASPALAVTGTSIVVDDVTLSEAGPCPEHPELVAVAGSFGNGCVSAVSWNEIVAVVHALDGSPGAIADRRMTADPPEWIMFQGGDRLELNTMTVVRAGRRVAADPSRARELVAALLDEAEIVGDTSVDDIESNKPTGHLTALSARGRNRIYWDAAGFVFRDHERLKFRPTTSDLKIYQRGVAAYVDDHLWTEDPTSITAIEIDHVTYRRGAVLGEWTRDPSGKIKAAALDALASALAAVRAPASEGDLAVAHEVTVTITPPVGAPSKHTLEIAAGCAARVDGARVTLSRSVCAAVAAAQ
ncbi:MAG: hypothetical protein JWO36_6799 [Myxococcales bacterium]|nr:hypothetical protein [Myxococcales bacterium]